MTLGGVPLSRVVVVTLVVALLLGSVIAIALCLSALLSRTTTSGVLAYLAVFALTVGTLIAFGLATALTTETVTVQGQCPSTADLQNVPEPDRAQILGSCAQPFQSTRARTDRVWWLLAPNPFVVLADAAPQLPSETASERAKRRALEATGVTTTNLRDSDPLGSLGRSVRSLRRPPVQDEPNGLLVNVVVGSSHRPVWPYGLAFDILLGAGAVWLTARKLRTPTRDLPRGQRVA